jgi:hypothetical protein
MNSWFDDFVKRHAAPKMSRREALRGLGTSIAAVGGAVGGLGLIADAFGQVPADRTRVQAMPQGAQTLSRDRMRVQQQPGLQAGPNLPVSCARTRVGAATIHDLTTIAGGLSLRQQISNDRSNNGSATTLTFLRGQNSIAKIDIRMSQTGASSTTITYGPEVQGIRSATVTSQDGNTFQGTIDGRQFVVSGRVRSLAEVRFADGGPPPQITTDPAIRAALPALLSQSRSQLARCSNVNLPLVIVNKPVRPGLRRPPTVRRPPGQTGALSPRTEAQIENPRVLAQSPGNRVLTQGQIQSRGALTQSPATRVTPQAQGAQAQAVTPQVSPNAPTPQRVLTQNQPMLPRDSKAAGNWHSPMSHGSPTCDHCVSDGCGDDYEKCLFDNAIDFLCPPCIVPAVATCLAYYFVCQAGCYLPGKGCCPVLCGTPVTDECCADNETCMSEWNVCCPPNRPVCSGYCCDNDVWSCAPDGYCGCAGSGVPCGDMCCEGNQTCCGEECCTPDKVCCGGYCCSAGNCHGDTCCEAPNHMCGNTCCAPFSPCCNGVCCAGSCVNGQCCPAARVCGSACCAADQACLNPSTSQCGTQIQCGGPGQRYLQACRSMKNGQFVSICCSVGADCCNGQCCPIGQQCCAIGGGQAICALPYQCVH